MREDDELGIDMVCGNCSHWCQLYEGGNGVCMRQLEREVGLGYVKPTRLLEWVWQRDVDPERGCCDRFEEVA